MLSTGLLLASIMSTDPALPALLAPPVPSVEGWNVAEKPRQLKVKTDDYRTVLLGLVTEYQNPKDPNDFVKVYSRHVAIISERANEKKVNPNQGRSNLSGGADTNYHSQKEKEVLERVQKAVDPFAYVHYRLVKDPRTGHNILSGSLETWLLDQSGVWAYSSSTSDAFQITQLSEPLTRIKEKKNGTQIIQNYSDRSVLVGFQFSLANATQIVRADQSDLAYKEKSKGGK